MTELDPNGLSLNSPGAKADAGKPCPARVLRGFARAIWLVSKCGTFGADKYTWEGWMEVENGQSRYDDAMMRHWLKEAMGEPIDKDSELWHLVHESWNSLAKLELFCREWEETTKRSVIDL